MARHLLVQASGLLRRTGLPGVRALCSAAASMRKDDVVAVQQLGDITLIGINRPEKRNAINTHTAKKLIEAFCQFEENESAKIAVLFGKGGTFCSGFDLSELSDQMDAGELAMSSPNGPMGPTRLWFNKPVIAAISGFAVAGGLELALMCDLRVAEDTAVMGVFCRRFGVPLIDGGTVRLPRLIGLSRALDLILTGRPVKAQEALGMGLVNRVCETGSSLGAAVNLAREISKFPQECLRADRASAIASAYSGGSLDACLAAERDSALSALKLESVAGAKAFVSGIGRSGSFNLTSPIQKNQDSGS